MGLRPQSASTSTSVSGMTYPIPYARTAASSAAAYASASVAGGTVKNASISPAFTFHAWGYISQPITRYPAAFRLCRAACAEAEPMAVSSTAVMGRPPFPNANRLLMRRNVRHNAGPWRQKTVAWPFVPRRAIAPSAAAARSVYGARPAYPASPHRLPA